MKWRLIILVTIVLFSQKTKGQSDSLKLSEQYFREGMEAYNFSHSKQAIELFNLSIRANPKNAKAHLMAGKSILLTIGKRAALSHFKKAIQLDPFIDEDILFLIGQAYHYNELFDSALLYYDLTNQSLARSLKFGRVMKMSEVNWKIFECRNAKVFNANPVSVNITHLSSNINSEWPDYAPTISADESVMIYTSRRPDKNQNPSLAEDLEYYEEIFTSARINNEWQPANGIVEINSSFHNASVSLSPNGKEMFVYSDENGGDIYETDLQTDGTWSRPSRLNGFINSPYFESSAAITADGTRLFFISDRPEGYGGTDVYVTTKSKRGEWTNVQNLGPSINTERDEEDVFVAGNGRHIYFSSNGHAGMGDLDIYRSEYDSIKKAWSEPLNLGYPINSVENDIYFVLTGDERYAYFSSARSDSNGDQDIYRVDLKDWEPISREVLAAAEQSMVHLTAMATTLQPKLTESIVPVSSDVKAATTQSLTSVASIITHTNWIIQLKDETTQKPIAGDIFIVNDKGESAKMISTDGAYQLMIDLLTTKKVTAKITCDGYHPLQFETQLDATNAAGKLDQIIFLKKLTALPAFGIGNFSLFYESNVAVPQHQEVLDLVALQLKEDVTTEVVISSNTDNYGEEEYNLSLSQRRAEEAKAYLVKSGIDASRIKVVALGEAQPKGDNKTSTGRRVNRRTDLVIQAKDQ